MIRNALQRFMYGRYGSDQLNIFLLVTCLVLLLLSTLPGLAVLEVVSFGLMAWTLFRLLSRNSAARPGRSQPGLPLLSKVNHGHRH